MMLSPFFVLKFNFIQLFILNSAVETSSAA
jgi:hypothetical protein